MIKQCILLGYQGSGKTTLFNKLCKQDEKTSSQTDSCTKFITTAQSKDAFQIVDTPGISFCDNIFQHSITILAALTNGPIHKILLVVQYEYRNDLFKYMISKTLTLVKEYKQLLGVVITHFDLCKKQDVQKFQIDTKKMLKDTYQIDEVFFSSIDTNGEQLSFDIQKSLVQPGQILKISDDAFDSMMLEHTFDKTLEEGKKLMIKQLEKFKNTVMKFLSEFKETIDQDQILHSLLVFVRSEQNIMQEQFVKKYAPIMEDLHQKSNDPILAYYYYYVVKHYIKQMVQTLTNEINKRMMFPEDHPFRLLRRCSKCDTIWLRVIGCTDTYCGSRLIKRDEKELIQTQPIYNQYKFDYVKNEKIDYTQIETNHDQEQQFKNTQLNQLREYDEFQDFIKVYTFEFEISREKQLEQSDRDSLQTQESSFRSIDKMKKVNQKAQTVSPFGKKMKLQFLEEQQSKQIKKYGQIGCGQSFDWESAPLVNIDDIDLSQKELIALFTNKDIMQKEEYNTFKKEQLEQALLSKKNLKPKV